MVSRNEKSTMKLVRLPILRALLLKCEILCRIESFKNLEDFYGWVAGWQTLPPSHTNAKFSEFLNCHKISRLSDSSLKTGNLTNFIMLFSFLATILY